MGSRCHYPFGDRGGVRAHLLEMHTARTAATIGAYSVASEGRCSLPSGTVRIVAALSPERNSMRWRGTRARVLKRRRTIVLMCNANVSAGFQCQQILATSRPPFRLAAQQTSGFLKELTRKLIWSPACQITSKVPGLRKPSLIGGSHEESN